MEAIGHRERCLGLLGRVFFTCRKARRGGREQSRARRRNRGSRRRQRNSASTEAAAVSLQTGLVPLLLAAFGFGQCLRWPESMATEAAAAAKASGKWLRCRGADVVGFGAARSADAPAVRAVRACSRLELGSGLHRVEGKVFFIGRNSRKFSKFPFYPQGPIKFDIGQIFPFFPAPTQITQIQPCDGPTL